MEARGGPPQAVEDPARVAIGAEEVTTHVVVDAVDLEAARIEVADGFGADEPAAAGHEHAAQPRSGARLRGPRLRGCHCTSPRSRSSRSASAKRSTAGAVRAHATTSARHSIQSARGSKPSRRAALSEI